MEADILTKSVPRPFVIGHHESVATVRGTCNMVPQQFLTCMNFGPAKFPSAGIDLPNFSKSIKPN